MRWIILLHLRVPLCTVMLVASHCDELRYPHEEKKLLLSVERRVIYLRKEWMGSRPRKVQLDGRLKLLPGVIAVGCKLATDATPSRGLDEVMSKLREMMKTRFIPPSWGIARKVLEGVSNRRVSSAPIRPSGMSPPGDVLRPWVYLTELHKALEECVPLLKAGDPMKQFLGGRDTRDDTMDCTVQLM